MKKFNHPTDDFFREAIKDYQMAPSEKAREAFLRDAMQVPPPPKKFRKGLIALSLFLLLAITGIMAWFLTNHNQSGSRSLKPVEQTTKSNATAGNIDQSKTVELQTLKHAPSNVLTSVTKTATSFNSKTGNTKNNIQAFAINNDKTTPLQKMATANPSADPVFKNPEITKKQTAVQVIPEASTPGNQGKTEPGPAITENRPAFQDASTMNVVNGTASPASVTGESSEHEDKPTTSVEATQIIKTDTVIHPGRQESKPEVNAREISNVRHISAGVYYTPEWMFNTLEKEKFVNNFGIEGTFHFGPFSIRTGAGISITKGTNELSVEYNDLLGSYNKLDSMTFTWNNPTHQYVPNYYMTQQEVWDSLMKLDYPKVVKRYTYLQIPMILGYDFWQSGKVTIGFRVGPVMSILLSSKKLSEDYQPGNKRVIRINDITPEQESLNWQAMGGLNTVIGLTKLIQFEVEPSIRYYFNSVYEKPGTTWKPYSVGVRAAFVFKF